MERVNHPITSLVMEKDLKTGPHCRTEGLGQGKLEDGSNGSYKDPGGLCRASPG